MIAFSKIIGLISLALFGLGAPTFAQNSSDEVGSVGISFNGEELDFDQEKLLFPEVGMRSKVLFDSLNSENLPIQIFVRDRSIVDWDDSTKSLISREPGSTEIFVVYQKSMAILPVVVGFFVEDVTEKKLSIAGFSASSKKMEASLVETEDSPNTLLEAKTENRIAQLDSQAETVNVTVKFSDDRSDLGRGMIYPVIGLEVKIPGLDREYVTDEKGMVFLEDVPKNANLSVITRDVNGVYAATIHNVAIGGGDQLVDLHALRTFNFDNSLRLAGLVQDTNLGSVCLTVYDEEGTSAEGLEVAIDTYASGPYYYNKYGYLDDKLDLTSANGRACFYNVEPTIGAIYLKLANGEEKSIALDFVSGIHREESIYLAETSSPRVAFVTSGSAHDAIDSNNFEATNRKFISDVSLVGFGEEAIFQSGDNRVMEAPEEMISKDGRSWVYVDDEYFEPSVYSLSSIENGAPIYPLFPRGFVEDMAIMANVVMEYASGFLAVRYHGGVGKGGFVLTDSITGQVVATPYYYGKGSTLQALFFNLTPGQYVLSVENDDGSVVAVDTVLVYSDSLSYSQLGQTAVYTDE